jgi:phage terminase small subunit
MPKLKSSKQEAFAQHYVLTGNASEAYRKAYNTRTKNDATIYQSASKLLRDPKVSPRVEELQQAASERAEKKFGVDADWMLRRLKEIDEMDVADIMDDAGNILPVSQWPKVWRTSISALDMHELQGSGDAMTIIRKLKLPDKTKNLEMLGRHVKVQAFKDKVEHEHTGNFSIKELLQQAKEGK